jgi:division protein CdvB (Snf7/Vps24/ESCRT-III family)
MYTAPTFTDIGLVRAQAPEIVMSPPDGAAVSVEESSSPPHDAKTRAEAATSAKLFAVRIRRVADLVMFFPFL